MSLSIEKLENVRQSSGKLTARCPACAESGGDSQGVHLVVYPSGKYGCAAFPRDARHTKGIYRLVGRKEAEKICVRRPRPLTIRGFVRPRVEREPVNGRIALRPRGEKCLRT